MRASSSAGRRAPWATTAGPTLQKTPFEARGKQDGAPANCRSPVKAKQLQIPRAEMLALVMTAGAVYARFVGNCLAHRRRIPRVFLS